MTVGAISFAYPLALLALLALPAIWWLLRATPPEPRRAELPSADLLDDIVQTEETPQRTPLWIILLRMAAAALAIVGLSGPILDPVDAGQEAGGGSLLIVLDNGWTSAPRWRDMKAAAAAAAEEAARDGSASYILTTAPDALPNEPLDLTDAATVRRRLQSASPAAWPPDQDAALKRLAAAKIRPSRTLWITDGLDHGSTVGFARSLADIAPLDIRSYAPPGAFAISAVRVTPEGAEVTVSRAAGQSPGETNVVAETLTGASIASAKAEFRRDSLDATAAFALPSAALNKIERFRILANRSAGSVWLWDDDAHTPVVALADPEPSAQPLLEEFYYVRKALAPHARLIEGPLDDMLAAKPDAVIVGDRSGFPSHTLPVLKEWIADGGVLIRFAGPRLANGEDDLTPVPLRPAARAMGGALAWDEPQGVADFPADSPFSGLRAPADAQVTQQVLAQPLPDLAEHTWARLADGTPLVTARREGLGMLILFHVTANLDWSKLPYSGAYIDMLRRAASSGAGGGARVATADGSLTPQKQLDGFGELEAPSVTAQPIATATFADAQPSPISPPGLYAGSQGVRALNAGRSPARAMTAWPSKAKVLEGTAAGLRRDLGGALLALSLALILIDALVALAIAGRLKRFELRRSAGAPLLVLCALAASDPQPAQAQSADPPRRAAAQSTEKERLAAASLRFAYIRTGDANRDRIAQEGLFGLGWELFKRTAVEPAEPHAVTPGADRLELYPMIYYSPRRGGPALAPEAIDALNAYLRSGGALLIDTRDAVAGLGAGSDLGRMLAGLDVPPLQPTPADHVLTRSFYLIKDFPGRLPGGQLWIEADAVKSQTRRGDGVSGLFIGGADWAAAWAVDQDYRPIFPMENSGVRREMAYRFGVNLVMYVLTGNYKEDQVHLPSLLERLDREISADGDAGRVRSVITPDRPAPPRDLQDFFDRERTNRGMDDLPPADGDPQ